MSWDLLFLGATIYAGVSFIYFYIWSQMLNTDDLRKMHVCIATPCYGGQVFQNYFMSVLKLVFAANQVGLPLSFIVRGGDSLIPRTRNSIAAEFMSSDKYTHLLWVDADIGFEPDAIFRMLLVDREVVCGLYPLKKIVWPDGGLPQDMTREQWEALYTHYPYNPVPGATVDPQGFIEVLDAPTGLMLIKKSVFDKMRHAYPSLKYKPDHMLGLEQVAQQIDDLHYRFFDVMTEENGRYLSEDYAFCRRWQKLGGKVYIDARSNLTHQGGHLYSGNFLASLQARHVQHNKTIPENVVTAQAPASTPVPAPAPASAPITQTAPAPLAVQKEGRSRDAAIRVGNTLIPIK